MMRTIPLILAGAALSVAAFGSDAGIGPGSAAPAMDVKAWFKGKPVTKFDKTKTYVVEFWATWCGPCKTSIPHLTELAKKNADVTFIGVSIWEDNKDGNIQKFVDEMGPKMDYSVGWSSNKEGMAKTWMEAAGQNGIPSAFIVKGGQIQWIGHPMTMDEPLAQIKSGKFDVAKFKADFDKRAEESRQMMAARKDLQAIQEAYNTGKKQEAKDQLDALVKKLPGFAEQAETIRFGWLAVEDPKAWEAKAEELSKAGNWMALVDYALTVSSVPNADMAMPCKAMEFAVKATNEKHPIVLYYAAVMFDRAKDYKKGLEFAGKALAAIPGNEIEKDSSFKDAVTKLQQSISQKAGG